uniref:Groucho/TLE N-terminal Q-rich domain-containing protein n=1 Tax=Catharus ustulatus TaxID=91951 RepID=A0A8C3UBJ3_CATUS
MFPQGRHPPPLQPGQPFKFSVLEICDRIKEEFQFLQAQYHSLKLECEKLVSEKTEMQRHYVMYYEMSYGLNIEMHKQVSAVGARPAAGEGGEEAKVGDFVGK